jgi:DNA topoisomerase VI subunit B
MTKEEIFRAIQNEQRIGLIIIADLINYNSDAKTVNQLLRFYKEVKEAMEQVERNLEYFLKMLEDKKEQINETNIL